MTLDVLIGIAMGRAAMVADGRRPPFFVGLASEKYDRLAAEMTALGCSFGIPFDGEVAEVRGEGPWVYRGTVLSDVHVWGRESKRDVR